RRRPHRVGRPRGLRRRRADNIGASSRTTSMDMAEIGIIGGSGLHALAGQANLEERAVETPWGAPSGPYRIGTVAGRRVAFLARHGAGHRLLPSEINYRANVWGFRTLGVQRLISASAVGSLKEELAP